MAGWAAPRRPTTSASPPSPSTCVDSKRTLASDSSSVTGSAYGRLRRRAWSSHTRGRPSRMARPRSEEHTSELQSPCNLVCRLLLEKKKTNQQLHVATECTLYDS